MKKLILVLILLSLFGCVSNSQIIKKFKIMESYNRVQDLQLEFKTNHLEYDIEDLEVRVDSLEQIIRKMNK